MTATVHAPGITLRMARATWYRHRPAIAVILGLFGVATVVLLAEGAAMRSWLDGHGLAGCLVASNAYGGSRCDGMAAWNLFVGGGRTTGYITQLLRAAAPAAALFAGLPWLTREFETGSFRYTWVQGISPIQWLFGTFLPLAGTAVAAAAVSGMAFTWWYRVAQWRIGGQAASGWGWDSFELSPSSLVSWTAFAMALAMLTGMLIRRTVPAMASFVVVYAGCLILAEWQLRPRLFGVAPLITRWQWGGTALTPRWDDLFLRGWLTGPDGHPLSTARMYNLIGASFRGTAAQEDRWLAQHHYVYWIAYQSHARLVVFQFAWAAILLAASACAVLAAVWLLRRQSSW
jgi:hypothetical protein